MSRDREPAYSDLLQSLLSLRPDLAGERFDQLLAELLAADRIDPDAARELRWWQRESVRAVGDYLDRTAPPLLAALETSQTVAEQATRVAAEAWQRATATEPEPDRDEPEQSYPEQAPDGPVRNVDHDPGHRGPAGSGDGSLAPAHPTPEVVIDLRTGRGRGSGPTPPSATAAPATGARQPTVTSRRSRLLITGRSLQPGRPEST